MTVPSLIPSRCRLPWGKRQTNDSWLDKHLHGGAGAKRASNGKLWNYAIRSRTHGAKISAGGGGLGGDSTSESNEVVLDLGSNTPGDLSWPIRLNSGVRTEHQFNLWPLSHYPLYSHPIQKHPLCLEGLWWFLFCFSGSWITDRQTESRRDAAQCRNNWMRWGS